MTTPKPAKSAASESSATAAQLRLAQHLGDGAQTATPPIGTAPGTINTRAGVTRAAAAPKSTRGRMSRSAARRR